MGDKLTRMTVGDDVLSFGYDEQGSPMYVQWNNSRFFYATNIQGDVMAIIHTSGTAVVEYTYDAWGNILTTTGSMAETLGKLNPLRYRGYVYDDETGLYYLKSRYYDPEIGRFLNADDTSYLGADGTLLSYNLFAYCKNNPVFRSDHSGSFSISSAIIGGVTSFITSFALGDGLFQSLNDGFHGAIIGGLGTFAVACNAVLALFEFNSYMMKGMDLPVAFGLAALSFGTSLLSAKYFAKVLMLDIDELTEAVVDLTFVEAISLATGAYTTAKSNQYPKQARTVSTTQSSQPPATTVPYFHSGPGRAPANSYTCFF